MSHDFDCWAGSYVLILSTPPEGIPTGVVVLVSRPGRHKTHIVAHVGPVGSRMVGFGPPRARHLPVPRVCRPQIRNAPLLLAPPSIEFPPALLVPA